MHSVCLGVVRKILFLWRDSGRQFGITKSKIDIINTNIYKISKHWPSDFVRKPRSLKDLEHWKATELRQFLLYIAPLAIKNEVPDKMTTFSFWSMVLLS